MSMTIEDLRQELARRGADMSYLRLGEVEANVYDVCCITCAGGVWETFYLEGRGKQQLCKFSSEDEACRHFLNWTVRTFKLS